MATKHTDDMKNFSKKHNLTYSNFFTIGSNPKIEKNTKISNVPTAILMLLNTAKACPAAGSCRKVCLITSGNPIYKENKMKCRLRRNNAFMNDYSMFLRYLVINSFMHYSKNRNFETIGYRFNGISDYKWESIAVKLEKSDCDYILKAFNIYIEPIRYDSIIECIQSGLDITLNQSTSKKIQCYDYSKRIDRDYKKAKKLNYHLTLSHGSKFDTFTKSIELGLNYAAAFNLKKSQSLPTKFEYRGKVLTVIDGDLTDARFTDINTETHIIGLRFKIVENKNNKDKLAFCIA
tara:strand:+ start:204 stop:1076 length:873 start_codon:yes stop_codon:yes gene_type:complete